MKKRFLLMALTVVILATIISALPVAAAWVGGIRSEASIKEPLVPTIITFDEQNVFPSQEVAWASEIKNTSPLPYGIRYDTWVFYEYQGLGMGISEFARADAKSAPVLQKQTQKLTLSLSMVQAKAGGLAYGNDIGELTLMIDPDGAAGPLPEKKYVPGSVVDIQPGGTHALKLKLKVSPEAYSGTVVSYIDPYRTAPTVSPTLAPIPAP